METVAFNWVAFVIAVPCEVAACALTLEVKWKSLLFLPPQDWSEVKQKAPSCKYLPAHSEAATVLFLKQIGFGGF